jgi:amino acid transporter
MNRPSDAVPIAGDEHHSLKRVLTAVTNGAITFAGVGVFGGLMSLYGFSMSSAGPAVFWGWPITLVSVGALVLVFAQLASHFPFAGSMYQWPMLLSNKRAGWAIGWIYACALFPLMTAYYASLPVVVSPVFGWSSSFSTNRNIIIFAMLFALLWNLLKVGVLGRLAQWGMVFELAVVLSIIVIVFAIGPKDLGSLGHMSHVVTSGKGAASVQALSFGSWAPALLGGGIFVSYWVLYTFENGGTLGEETKEASRNAPRGILGAFSFVAICGILFLVLLTASLPHPAAAMLNGTPAQDAIGLHLPGWTVKLFLVAVSEGLLLATSTMFAGATRHIFGMARDGQIPLGKIWTLTTKAGAPWAASLLVAGLSLVPVFLFTTNTAAIVGGATAAMYVAYFLVTVVALWAALRGWPARRAHFHLGRWTIPVTVVAMVGTGATALNLLWPRAATNPTYDQITGAVTHSFVRHIPMGWYIVGVPLVLGVVYYIGWQRRSHIPEIRAQVDSVIAKDPAAEHR